MKWRTLGCFLPFLLLAHCGGSDSTTPAPASAGGSGGTAGAGGRGGAAAGGSAGSAGSAGTTQGPNLVGAKGMTINEVAIYQSVKRTLMAQGMTASSNVPLIPKRDALLRVFVAAGNDYNGQEVTARLHIEGGDPIEVKGVFPAGAQSTDGDLNSTVNFEIPGDRIGASFNYRVEFLQEGEEGSGNAGALYPAQGTDNIAADGKANIFRVVLAPFQYNADGSGRVPDMSDAKVKQYRDRLYQLYPVSDVQIQVRQPHPWNQTISADGSGWQQVGFTLSGFRSADGEGPEAYYYGIFNPAATFQQFCGFGCLLGVTLLNATPADTGNPMLRLALGIGYDGYAANTMAHELGHSHGREHAPCAPGGQIQSVDPGYPYNGAKIGVWGYDTIGKKLVNPNVATDIMGYCDNQWISDYQYLAFHKRGQNVNVSAKIHGELKASDWTIIALDGKGHGEIAGNVQRKLVTEPQGDIAVTVFNQQHMPHMAKASFHRWDHLPGGWLLLPKAELKGKSFEFVADGVHYHVEHLAKVSRVGRSRLGALSWAQNLQACRQRSA